MAAAKCRGCGKWVSGHRKVCRRCGGAVRDPERTVKNGTVLAIVLAIPVGIVFFASSDGEGESPVVSDSRPMGSGETNAVQYRAEKKPKVASLTNADVASVVSGAMYNEETRALEFELTELAKLQARHPQCEELQGVGLSPSRSSPGRPVFFTQCKTPDGDFFNTDYTVTQILNKELQVVDSYSYDQAHEWCGRMIRQKLNHPGTYDEHMLDVGYEKRAGGRSTMVIGFSAKNGLGIEMDYRAVCRLERGRPGSVAIRQQ